jgi:Tol biopolymer transport system component
MRDMTVDDDRLLSRLRDIAEPVEPAPVFLDRLYESLAQELGFRRETATRTIPTSRFALIAALIIVAVATVFAGSQVLPTGPAAVPPSSSPAIAGDGPPPVGNGLIAIGRDDGILLLDPTTGRTVTRLEAPLPWVTDITWAPDGKRLAFNLEFQFDVDSTADPSLRGVWVMDVSTGRSKQLLHCGSGPNACGVAWSPDGSRIAVTHGNLLDLIDPIDGNATLLEDFGRWAFHPTWSPDSARIAVSLQNNELAAVDRDGSGRATLSRLPDIGGAGAKWSPDGSTFAYIPGTEVQCPEAPNADACAGQYDLTIMSLLLATNTPEELGPGGRCWCAGVGPSLGWSPDGRKLVLILASLSGGAGGGDFGLFVMNADGSDLRLLSEGHAWSPAWQPVPR